VLGPCTPRRYPEHPGGNAPQKTEKELQAKHVLPNINCAQAAERAENAVFLSLVTLTLTFKLVRARDQTRVPYEFGANPFSGSGDISYTKEKVTDSAKKTEPYTVDCMQ